MPKKYIRLPLAGLCAAALALTACGSTIVTDSPGSGKWRDSDLAGSVKESDEIRPNDDFAAAANREFILSAKEGDGAFVTAMLSVADKKQAILENPEPAGSSPELVHEAEQLRIFSDLAADWELRGQMGAEPLLPYLEAISDISSPEDLTRYESDPEKNPFALGLLMPDGAVQSFADPGRYSLSVASLPLLLGSEEEYFNLTSAGIEKRDYVNTMTEHILSRLGWEKDEIRRLLAACYRMEKKIAGAQVALPADEDKQILFTPDEAADAAEGYPLKEILLGRGFPEDCGIYMNPETAGKLSALCGESCLDDLKAMMTVHLVMTAAPFLDRKTYELNLKASAGRGEKPLPDRFPADRAEQKILQDYVMNSALEPILDRIYVTRYAGDLDQKGLEAMTAELIDVYHDIFGSEPWLSDAGRAACIEKLEALKMHVVTPDFDMVDYSGLDIRSAEEGGSFFEAVCCSARCRSEHSAYLLTIPCSRDKWDPFFISTTTTNAIYMPTANGIFIFAGALEKPVYSADMSYEEKLGGIGAVIGHEITHGFDSSGAQYNKEGAEEYWMPLEDQMAFNDKCDMVAQYFTTIRPFPGSGPCDGRKIKEEATADMGGIRSTLAVAEKHENFNYDTYFRQYAAIWAEAVGPETEQAAFESDVHPLSYLRVNVTLQQFDKFCETYGIQEGDGMYLAPDQRVAVW